VYDIVCAVHLQNMQNVYIHTHRHYIQYTVVKGEKPFPSIPFHLPPPAAPLSLQLSISYPLSSLPNHSLSVLLPSLTQSQMSRMLAMLISRSGVCIYAPAANDFAAFCLFECNSCYQQNNVYNDLVKHVTERNFRQRYMGSNCR